MRTLGWAPLSRLKSRASPHMNDTARDHWDQVYLKKTAKEVSWYQPSPERSLALMERAGLARDAEIIDVGGGISSLPAELLLRGYTRLTIVDISEQALRSAEARLGEKASQITWVRADICAVELPQNTFSFWHDRAVYHFLTDATQRALYTAAVRRSLLPGGYLLISGFGPEGPEKCSGLAVRKIQPDELQAELGSGFQLLAWETEEHLTPWGSSQAFVYAFFRRTA